MRTWQIDSVSVIATVNWTSWSACLQACDRSPLTQRTDGQQRQGGKKTLRNQCCCPDVACIWSLKKSLCEGGVCVYMCVCVCVLCRLPRGLGFRHGTRQGVFSPSLSPACLCCCWCALPSVYAANVSLCVCVCPCVHGVNADCNYMINLCKGLSADHSSLVSPLPMIKDMREQQGWESRL